MVTQEQIAGALADLRELRAAAQKIAALLEQERRPAEVELSAVCPDGDAISALLNRLRWRPVASGDRASDTPE